MKSSLREGKPLTCCTRSPCRQRGQALIYGLFVLTGGLAALFFLFNTGQLSREKTKLVNTADAVAYSAGLMHARTLNFQAYTNRAMMANTVAIAQLVSLSSWVQYVDSTATYGFMLGDPSRYVPYYPSYLLTQTQGAILDMALVESGMLEKLAKVSDDIIRQELMTAQHIAYQGLELARQSVMNDVANANYLNDGSIVVEPMLATTTAFQDFVKRYKGEERTRFAEVAEIAAKRDGFQRRRSWMLPALYPLCSGAIAMGRTDWIDRRGGTELIGFDEWKAVDTISEKRWAPKNKTDVFCQALNEHPSGWGAQSAADQSSSSLNPTDYDSSLLVNPAATLAAVASSDSWGYSGIPDFYDLTESMLNSDDPKLIFAVRLRREKSQTVTSEGQSAIEITPRLNAYQASLAGGNDLVAVSASEVYFQRPDMDANCSDGSFMGRGNCYGRVDVGRAREIGSLFNPYWHVRLIQHDSSVNQARALQGVGSP
jgi:hypothetical protein